MQKRLLSETTLTFKKAVEIATSMEIAAKNAEDLQTTQNSTSTNTTQETITKKSTENENKMLWIKTKVR